MGIIIPVVEKARAVRLATRMNESMRRLLVYFTFLQTAVFASSRHACAESRVVVGGYIEVTVDCSETKCSDVHLGTFPEETIDLILRGSCIQVIPTNAFRKLLNLRSLDLSHNAIHTLHEASFHGLSKLRKLNLNHNDIRVMPVDIFSKLYSLEILMMSGTHQNYSLPTLSVNNHRKLRVLSLTLTEGATIPASYGKLPNLKIMDFFGNSNDDIQLDVAMLSRIRRSNISSLAFRQTSLCGIEPGAISNLSYLRSLNLCCNKVLGFKKTIAALAQTENSIIDTVVLDAIQSDAYVVHDMSDFCSPFWSKIRRLSIKKNQIIGVNLTKKHCLAELREFDLSGNPVVFIDPNPRLGELWMLPSRLCSISISQQFDMDCCHGTDADFPYDVTKYFFNGPSCVIQEDSNGTDPLYPTSDRTAALGLFTINEVRRSSHNLVRSVYIQPSMQIIRCEHLRTTAISVSAPCVLNVDNNIRHISVAHTPRFNVFTPSIYNLHQLQTLDMSHGKLKTFKPQLMPCHNLSHIDISHNILREGDIDIQTLCTECPKLENIDLSFNRLNVIIDPHIFSACSSLKHVQLGGNALQEVELELTNIIRLDSLDLHSNKLNILSSKFTAELDNLYKVKKFTLDIRNNYFVCSCESVAFVRWIQTTEVEVVGRGELSCLMNNKRTLFVNVSLAQMDETCSSSHHVVIISVLVIIFSVAVFVVGLVWNRWYIKYRIIVCNLFLRKKTSAEHEEHYDAMVLYFAYPTKPAHTAASHYISTWILTQLLPLAEREEGLRLYIFDRDAPAMTKGQLFISAYEKSDKLIVCITPELLDDNSCTDAMNLVLASKKPLRQFIIINFCGEDYAIRSKLLRHLMKPTSGATYLVWNENDDDHSDFRRRLRGALNRGLAGDGCAGLLARTRQPSADVSWREIEQLNPV